MANINDAFPSKYLKASDFGDDKPTVTISAIQFEEVGKDKEVRPILYFDGEDKGIVLNKTNATNISKAYGAETDDWIGKQVQIGTTMVDFQGQSVEAIRLYPPRRSSVNAPLKPSNGQKRFDDRNPPPPDNELNDDVPF